MKNVPSNLNNMKSKGDKLCIQKLEITPVDVIKKTKCDELVKTINAIQTTDTSDLIEQPDYNTKLNDNGKNH